METKCLAIVGALAIAGCAPLADTAYLANAYYGGLAEGCQRANGPGYTGPQYQIDQMQAYEINTPEGTTLVRSYGDSTWYQPPVQ